MNEKGWLPEGMTQNDLDDGDFAWLSDAYKRGDEAKSKGRKLPYKIHGKVNEAGWHAAWSRAHQDGTDFSGGPSQADVIATLRAAKPAGVDINEDDTLKSAPAPRREYKTLPFKEASKADDLEEDEFKGYLAAFGNIDDGADVILQGAFLDTIPTFVAKAAVCWQHDWMTPIGKWLAASEDPNGLFVKGKISQTTVGKDALILLRDNVIQAMSIGYDVLGYKMLSDAEGIAMFGESAYTAALRDLPWYQDGVRALTAIKLYEGSLVTVPMNPKAVITGVKDISLLAGLPHDAHFDAVLAAVGEYTRRVKALAALRGKSGRMLSAANADRLQTMRESLSNHVVMLDDMISANNPGDDPDNDGDPGESGDKGALITEIRRQQLRFLQEESRRNGAA